MKAEKVRNRNFKIYKLIAVSIATAIFILIIKLFVGSEFDVSKDSEVQHSLFSQLDPTLGYAHNEKYQLKKSDEELGILFDNVEYTHLKNGFIKMSYQEDRNPKKILILGSSSTDPYLFNGNWPLQFHLKLTRQGTPHVIYNGAVSGYNSFQILIKLARDGLILDKMDYLITYFGGNDFIGNEDVLEGHPNIHPYQKKLFESVGLQSKKDLDFWDKLFLYLKTNRNDLEYGVANNNYLENLIMNIKNLKALCNVNNVSYIHVVEAVISDESQRIFGSKLSVNNPEAEKKIRDFLVEFGTRVKSEKYIHSIQALLPTDKKIFYDSVHLSVEGNQFLSEAIYSLVDFKIITK